jgi:hypothetical protein
MSVRKRRTQIAGQFAAHRIDMLRSPAWRVLTALAGVARSKPFRPACPRSARDRARRPRRRRERQAYGIHRHAIGPAIREVVALGFAEITEAGRAGNAEFRKPNVFRLTYLNTNLGPTDEWQKITENEAEAIARAARSSTASKTQNQCRKMPNFDDGNRHRKARIRSTETITTGDTPETDTTIYIWGRGRANGHVRVRTQEGEPNP